jgi:hypothetical protein
LGENQEIRDGELQTNEALGSASTFLVRLLKDIRNELYGD